MATKGIIVSHSLLSTLQLINACSVSNSLSHLKRNCRSCTFVVTNFFFFKPGFLPGLLKGPCRLPLYECLNAQSITTTHRTYCESGFPHNRLFHLYDYP